MKIKRTKSEQVWNVLWRIFETVAILTANCCLIFFIVQKCFAIDVKLANGETMSVELIQYWKWIKVWRWWYSMLLYTGIIAGALISLWLIGILYRHDHDKRKEKIEDQREQQRQTKEDEREKARQLAEDKRMKELAKILKEYK